ncbi:hypothetical protein CDEST_09039 [Colletotrichum destructivum]|uniref:Zn(2)-C6 fungal-type domain-containing protein n=1 Tax=Colletotrichum destructivum TaxID=34406 RepID=A0AAX4IKP8_9PEZI|nr:hypothetical protein CDEST_09039 [Colletotrichum destructivum]
MPSSRPFRPRRQTPRVSKACHHCRAGKVKCDGAKPQCGTCTRQSRECEYTTVDGRKTRHSEAEFLALRNRIAFLESRLTASQPIPSKEGHDTQLVTHSGCNTPQPPCREEDVAALEANDEQRAWAIGTNGADNVVGVLRTPEYWQIDELFPGLTPTAHSESSLLQVFVSILGSFWNDRTSGKRLYVGPTSNLHLSEAPAPPIVPSSWLQRVVRPPLASCGAALPEDELLNCYWVHVNPHFQLYSSEHEIKNHMRRNPLLRTSVLAVGGLFLEAGDADSDERSLVRDSYIERCVERFTRLSGEAIEVVSLSNVQAFLLRSYLATMMGRLESATIFLGIACNMAKIMGLHVNPDSLRGGDQPMPPTPIDSDRKRTFWACFRMDRCLAILEGRAVLMAACDISVEPPLREALNTYKSPGAATVTPEVLYAFHIDLADLQDKCLGKILCYHTGLLLLHRPALKSTGHRDDHLANSRCSESASAIAGLLKAYSDQFANSVADSMVVHAAFTGALAQMVLLEHPDIASYYKTTRALKTIVDFLVWVGPRSEYARNVYNDLRQFALKWSIKPANSPTFWQT